MQVIEQPPAILAWMSALADPTRARLLRLVEQHELTVADLCAVLQLPQSTVSRHLKVLFDEGWVAARAEATSRLYRMARDQQNPAARRLWGLLREQTEGTRLAQNDDRRLQSVLAQRQSRSQAFFTSSAGHWDRLRSEMFGERFDLLALPGLLDAEWVFGDLGCGTGQLSASVAPFVARVIAVDGSRAMLRAARQRLRGFANVDVRQGDLAALPVDDATLDAATLCLVLHHIPEPVAVLRAAGRALRPGGRLLVIDMIRHDRREYQHQMGHVWLGFDAGELTSWFEAAGFEAIHVRPLPPTPRAKGPGLFAASGRRASTPTSSNGRRKPQ